MRDRSVSTRRPLEAQTQAVVDEAFEIALPTYLQSQPSLPPLGPPQTAWDLACDESVVGGNLATRRTGVLPGEVSTIETPALASSSAIQSNASSFETVAAVYPGAEWSDLDPGFDPLEAMHAFDAYNSFNTAGTVPMRRIPEMAVDDFFDYSKYRS